MMIIIIVLFVICCLDLTILSSFCRIEKRLHAFRKQKAIDSTINESNENNEYEKNKRSFSNILKKVYFSIYPYLYGWMRYSTIRFGRIPSYRIRNLIYKYVFCMDITKKTVIGMGGEIRSPWNIKADRLMIMGPFILDGRNGITFENDVVLGSGVHIWTEEHDVNDEFFRVNSHNKEGVVIKQHAWICSDSTILPGVTIETGTVIASKACATKSTEKFGIYAGIPAKKIADRNSTLSYILDGKPTWHFY